MYQNQFNTTPVFLICNSCSSEYRVSPRRKNNSKFCTLYCYNISKKGKIFANYKHGLTRNPIYGIWKGMRKRCNNPKEIAYKNYGGRGITISKEWNNVETFIHDMYPSFKRELQVGY